jgi:hypothetical protein
MFTLALAAGLLAGCGSAPSEEATNDSTKSSTDNSTDKSKADEGDSSADNSKSNTPPASSNTTDDEATEILQDLIDQLKPSLAAMEESSGMTIDLSIRGHAFVYTFAFTTDSDVANTEAIESYIGGQASVFEMVAGSIKSVGVEDASVIVEYLSKDGKLLFSKEFFPN